MGDRSKVVSLQPQEPDEPFEDDEAYPDDGLHGSAHDEASEGAVPNFDGTGAPSGLIRLGPWRGTRTEAAMGVGIGVLALVVIGFGAHLMSAPWANDARIESAIEGRITAAERAVDEKIAAASEDLSQRTQTVSSELALLKGRVATLAADFDGKTSAIDGLEADVLLMQTEFKSEIADLRADHKALRTTVRDEGAITAGRIDALEQRWHAIEESAQMVQRSSIPPQRATITLQDLPFRPVSLDRWGGAAQLAVERGAEFRFLSEGDRLDGWRVGVVDADSAILTGPNGGELRLLYKHGRFDIAPDDLPTLTVLARPADARIRVMNIRPVYRPAMPLAPGAYDIEVTRPGYAPVRKWVRLGDSDRTVNIHLTRSN